MQICNLFILDSCHEFECKKLVQKDFKNGDENKKYYICSSLGSDICPNYLIPKNLYIFDESTEKIYTNWNI